MKVSDSILNMINTLNENVTEATKHESGNHAAGTRLRKILQDVATCCKDLRAQVQTERNERK
jgi:hypothetical protein